MKCICYIIIDENSNNREEIQELTAQLERVRRSNERELKAYEETAREIGNSLHIREEEKLAQAELNKYLTGEHSKNIQVVVKMVLRLTEVINDLDKYLWLCINSYILKI